MAQNIFRKKQTLDLRYNDLWSDWDAADELQDKTGDAHGQLLLSWKKLNVSVKQTTQKFFRPSEIKYKKILNNINGNVRNGTLLGIMGPSGSGKTTLLATISHRTKGNFDGELLFNGRPISEGELIKMSGFVPQHDVSFEQLTALEHLCLMATFKMDRGTTGAEARRRVDVVSAELGAGGFLDTRLSLLSGGERKKVALAVQLLNDPPVLFCDEITTGLDSYAAAHVVGTLRRVARTGKIVVCTIHQPASGVFGKFDEVLLMSDGRLVCQGPVPAVRRLFERFNYECPRMFNEADYVISVLNSDSAKVKSDLDEMCKLSSSIRTEDDFHLFSYQKESDHLQHLQTKKPLWKRQFSLIFKRSLKCFLRSYKTKILELGMTMFLGLIISSPYANTTLDSQAVQNLEGFWLTVIFNCLVSLIHSAIPKYHLQFSIIHRDIHNEVYSLSAYYASELIIMVVWTVVKMLFYSVIVFTIVGVKWGCMELFVIFIVAFTGLSHGTLLSTCFNNIQNVYLCTTLYDYLAISISGGYLSLKSLPKSIYLLRFLSLYFLGCELASILFWEKIPHLPCSDVDSCLNSGEAVLNKYGYISGNFYLDITILISFCVLANVRGYYGLLRQMRRQPAY